MLVCAQTSWARISQIASSREDFARRSFASALPASVRRRRFGEMQLDDGYGGGGDDYEDDEDQNDYGNKIGTARGKMTSDSNVLTCAQTQTKNSQTRTRKCCLVHTNIHTHARAHTSSSLFLQPPPMLVGGYTHRCCCCCCCSKTRTPIGDDNDDEDEILDWSSRRRRARRKRRSRLSRPDSDIAHTRCRAASPQLLPLLLLLLRRLDATLSRFLRQIELRASASIATLLLLQSGGGQCVVAKETKTRANLTYWLSSRRPMLHSCARRSSTRRASRDDNCGRLTLCACTVQLIYIYIYKIHAHGSRLAYACAAKFSNDRK